MLKMSFYNGTLDRAVAEKTVSATNKRLMHRYGFAYRGAEKRPIDKDKAIAIIKNNGNYLDVTEDEDEILLNTYSSNDMW